MAHVGRREIRNAYRILVGRPESRTLGRPTRKWEANIKMDLQELGWGGLYWIDLAEDRDRWAGCCEYANELSGCKKGGQFLD